jgi:hypothetical protein
MTESMNRLVRFMISISAAIGSLSWRMVSSACS